MFVSILGGRSPSWKPGRGHSAAPDADGTRKGVVIYFGSSRRPCRVIAQLVFLLDCLCAGGGQKERAVRQGEGPPPLDT